MRLLTRFFLDEPPSRRFVVFGSIDYDVSARHAALLVRYAPDLVIDLVDARVQRGGAVTDLERKPGLLALVRPLAESPGTVLSLDEIARHAWNVPYHRVRHHSRMVVTVKRVRELLGEERVRLREGGYELDPSPGLARVLPLS